MKAPVIGITSFRASNTYGYPRVCVNEAYVASLSQAGAVPLIIPLGLDEDQLEAITERIDGILFSGGGDVHPVRYGSQPHPLVDGVDEDRDRVELFLFSKSIARRIPLLGICRGLQLINVAVGGDLYEDICDQHPGSLQHQSPADWPREQVAHSVRIEQESQLSAIFGQSELPVNSLHHQGIKRIGEGLQATAFAPDGIIEAFEIADYPYGIGVQWHPEVSHTERGNDLLKNFFEICRNY